MAMFNLRYDLRRPEFARVTSAELAAAALEQCEFADRHGFLSVTLSEHHGSPDGYLPSPLVFAAAVAARTRQVRIMIAALIAPLHDPIRIAEDLAMVEVNLAENATMFSPKQLHEHGMALVNALDQDGPEPVVAEVRRVVGHRPAPADAGQEQGDGPERVEVRDRVEGEAAPGAGGVVALQGGDGGVAELVEGDGDDHRDQEGHEQLGVVAEPEQR